MSMYVIDRRRQAMPVWRRTFLEGWPTEGNPEGCLPLKSINPRLALEHLGIATKIYGIHSGDATETPAIWNDDLDLWQMDSEGLYYHRNVDGSERFFAMTAAREEVKWNISDREWYRWDTTINNWFLNSDNKKMKWILSNFIPQS